MFFPDGARNIRDALAAPRGGETNLQFQRALRPSGGGVVFLLCPVRMGTPVSRTARGPLLSRRATGRPRLHRESRASVYRDQLRDGLAHREPNGFLAEDEEHIYSNYDKVNSKGERQLFGN